MEVDDVESFVPLLAESGCACYRKDRRGRIKFRDPERIDVELIPKKKN
jgi:hypothetical protein